VHLHEDFADHRLLVLRIRIADTVLSDNEPIVVDFLSEAVVKVEADVLALLGAKAVIKRFNQSFRVGGIGFRFPERFRRCSERKKGGARGRGGGGFDKCPSR